MPIDPGLLDAINTQQLVLSTHGSARIGAISENSMQALSTIQANLLHQHGGVGDDPGVMSALRTAVHIPVKS